MLTRRVLAEQGAWGDRPESAAEQAQAAMIAAMLALAHCPMMMAEYLLRYS